MQLERIDTELTALLIDLSPVIGPTLRELLGTLRAVRRIIERSSANEQIFLGLNDERMRRAAQLNADLCQDLEAGRVRTDQEALSTYVRVLNEVMEQIDVMFGSRKAEN